MKEREDGRKKLRDEGNLTRLPSSQNFILESISCLVEKINLLEFSPDDENEMTRVKQHSHTHFTLELSPQYFFFIYQNKYRGNIAINFFYI